MRVWSSLALVSVIGDIGDSVIVVIAVGIGRLLVLCFIVW